MKSKKFFKRLTSLLLVLSMMIATLPALVSGALTSEDAYKRESDAVTLNDWKNYFGTNVLNTAGAGRIWNDKSVFTDPSILGSLINAEGNAVSVSLDDRNFLVALSAIATNKSIVGYSHIPTDTVLVLDISGSMGPGSGANRNDAVADMVTAANAAITSLQGLNNHNRVGIVLYSEGSQVLLPLDRYTTTKTEVYDNGTPGDPSDDKTIGVYLQTNTNRNTVAIATEQVANPNYDPTDRWNNNPMITQTVVKDSSGNRLATSSVSVTGGTYIQVGLDAAKDMFLAVPESDTVISGSDFQNGTERKPVFVLMSDGEPTYGSTNYSNVPQSSNLGGGSSTSNNILFLTQLTAAYAKARVSEHYNDVEPLFYTLGLGGTSSVLDPNTSGNSVKNLWRSFVNLDEDENLLIGRGSVSPTPYITSTDDMYYVTSSYTASSTAALYETFEKIVNQIIIQSLYSPTEVSTTSNFDGFITFTDVLYDYMEVKEIEGILIGNTLFTGEHLAAAVYGTNNAFGTPGAPSALGNDFIWAVIQRMGLNNHEKYPTYADQVLEARSLINLAYTHGQLYYSVDENTGEVSYNNFIGWYADKDGKYIGFWDPEHTDSQIPDNAVYTNKCYGMLGTVKDGLRESDMLYITIQIHTEIATGKQTVVFSVPSSLIPVVSYNITISGESLDDAGDISVEIDSAEPIRLLYEIGLRSDINTVNIASKVDPKYRNADGTYTFYTNAYDNQIILDEEAREDEFSHVGEPGVNTNSNFNPSKENERYYYNVDTPIYILSGGDFVPYTESTHPEDIDLDTLPLYREYTHFKFNDADGKWHLYTEHAEIHHATLVSAKRYTDGSVAGEWYIPAGTIHHNLDARERIKGDGDDADTLPDSVNDVKYVAFPLIEEDDVDGYHLDMILGNNAKLTVTPATALAVTKNVDETITDLNATYYFTVSGGVAGGSYAVAIEDANGNFVNDSRVHTFDASGKAYVSAKAGTTVYLVGLNEGTYSVTEEIVSGANYHVKSISVNGNEVSGENVSTVNNATVENQKVTFAEFVNTLGVGDDATSYLIINKTVTHDFGDDYTVDPSKTFPISIDLGDTYALATLEIHSTKHSAPISATADANGVITYGIAHGEHITLEVKVGTAVTVNEDLGSAYPGFNAPVITYTNGSLTGSAAQTVVEDSNLVVNIVNDYDAQSVRPVNMTLNVTKVLEGREWLDTDSFTFQLQRYNPHDAGYDIVGELSATKNNASLDFSQIIQAYTFEDIGQYHFRVIEVIGSSPIGGITYDTVGRYFNVIVGDELGGKLIITDVDAISLTSVTNTNGVWTVVANDVVNSYAPAGDDAVSVTIDKSVTIKDAPAGVTGSFELSGFEFGLYDTNGDLAISTPFVTDANGKAVISLTFPASVLDGEKSVSFYYTLKEIIPSGDTTYDYDTTEYGIRIDVIDNLDGTVRTELFILDEQSGEYNSVAGNNYTASFVNQYIIDGTVSHTDNIKKTVQNLGTASIDPEGFVFILKDANGTEIGRYTADESGDAQFTLTYGLSDVGKTFVYTLTELDTGVDNVTYSSAEYTVTARITLSAKSELVLEVTAVDSENAAVTGALEFVNLYDYSEVPDTGDNTLLIGISALILISLGALTLSVKKRRLA